MLECVGDIELEILLKIPTSKGMNKTKNNQDDS